MRIVFMCGPVPVPVLERGAYARADAAGVNVRMAIQPVGGVHRRRRDRAPVGSGDGNAGQAPLNRRQRKSRWKPAAFSERAWS
ncbi:hypothetical protein XarbCFBP7408_03410 [Xanthomonas arboricola pv. guizotiae]|uniref:Uncharacterized protein n=1 Tax=Xanthomonas arboricola pv. guizotiae TaxID=487867 RepID=A0A2S7A6U2_9XANT|nr:hypothetical protein XarbCFBP7409_01885 [Xanthomonas arboricola pv. guizotiae]PPU26179.1 hypothetical protein XarbCFBP7408_03410 [Xanthomonas arboricola pv. guizotiae]